MPSRFPGTIHQQALLARIVHHYEDDPRILAVCLFGSLVRGNADAYSDLDLDVILEQEVQVDPMAELHELCAAFEPLGESVLLMIPEGEDSGDVVLGSLSELSVRYHPLLATNPNIVDDLLLLCGRVDLGMIRVAGLANRKYRLAADPQDVDRILRWSIEVTIALRRGNLWQAVRLLDYIRDALAGIYAASRGYPRAFHALDQAAADPLAGKLASTLARLDPPSIRAALCTVLDILVYDLGPWSAGRFALTGPQQEVIAKVRGICSEP